MEKTSTQTRMSKKMIWASYCIRETQRVLTWELEILLGGNNANQCATSTQWIQMGSKPYSKHVPCMHINDHSWIQLNERRGNEQQRWKQVSNSWREPTSVSGETSKGSTSASLSPVPLSGVGLMRPGPLQSVTRTRAVPGLASWATGWRQQLILSPTSNVKM